MKFKKICFDIDNVVCTTNNKNDYSKSKPIKNNIKIICGILIFNFSNYF